MLQALKRWTVPFAQWRGQILANWILGDRGNAQIFPPSIPVTLFLRPRGHILDLLGDGGADGRSASGPAKHQAHARPPSAKFWYTVNSFIVSKLVLLTLEMDKTLSYLGSNPQKESEEWIILFQTFNNCKKINIENTSLIISATMYPLVPCSSLI